jgi:hypothetical protein
MGGAMEVRGAPTSGGHALALNGTFDNFPDIWYYTNQTVHLAGGKEVECRH